MSAPTMPARTVPAAEVAPGLDALHAELLTRRLTADHDVMVHEFLDIDPDIANRDYPPMPNARREVAR